MKWSWTSRPWKQLAITLANDVLVVLSYGNAANLVGPSPHSLATRGSLFSQCEKKRGEKSENYFLSGNKFSFFSR